MKRKITLILIFTVLCAVFAACGCAQNGDGSSSGKPSVKDEIRIKELIVKTMPDKTEYYEGQDFDPTGMVIQAVWYDDYKENLSRYDYRIEGGENLSTDVKSVSVIFEDGKAEVPVTVKPFEATSVEVTSMPTATVQLTEGKFDFTGLCVCVSNGEESIEIKSYSLFVGENEIDRDDVILAPGNNVITVKYKDLTTTFKVRYEKGYRVEFENILSTADLSGSETNFVEKTDTKYPFKEMVTEDKYASKGRYMGYVQKGDVIRLHIFAKEAGNARITIAAASNNVAQYKKAYYPDATDWWLPVEVSETYFYSSFAVSVNSVPVEADNAAVLPGSIALNEDGSINKEGDANLMLNWTEISLGEHTLEKGDNIVEIKCVSPIAANFDYAEVRFFGEHVHDEVTLDCVDAKAPTCSEEGNVGYYRCSVCGKTYSDFECNTELEKVTVDALPHTLEKIEIVSPATNTKYAVGERFDKTGLMVKAYCSVCGKSRFVTDNCAFSEIKAGDDFVTVSYTEGGVTKTCTQEITVINEYGVEGEYLVNWWDSKYFNPSAAGEDRIFIDKFGSKTGTSDTASGGGYFQLGGYDGNNNGARMLIYLYSDVETEVKLVLRVSSASAKTAAYEYGATDPLTKWNPVIMKNIVLKDGYKLTYRYDQNGEKTEATYLDTAVVEGETALNADGTINETGDTSLYTRWKEVEVAIIPLKRGVNIIGFEKLSDDYAVNVDRVYFRF